jgi:hypothetical protein
MSYSSRMSREEVEVSRKIQTYYSMKIATEMRLKLLTDKLNYYRREKARLKGERDAGN